MTKKTSIHVCAAKYGAEKHNRREKEMKHVHPEYSHLNKSWEASDFKSVADEIRKAKERYSQKHFCRKAFTDEKTATKFGALTPQSPRRCLRTPSLYAKGLLSSLRQHQWSRCSS